MVPGLSNHTIKIVQINTARTATANEDLLIYAQREKIDIALMQEPYVRRGRLIGLEASPIRIILSPGVQQRGAKNILHGAAIVIFNPAITVLARNDLTCDNFAVATISAGNDKEINLISAYFKYREPTKELTQTLRSISRACGDRTLVGADINAFSKNWFSKATDKRGLIVEDMIAEEQLILANKKDPLFTFSGPRGENNIDITLSTKDIANELEGWEVIHGEITSDHRLIRYSIGKGESFTKLKCKKRYVTEKANWQTFNSELTLEVNLVEHDLRHADLETRTELLMQAISNAADKSMPKRRIKTKQQPPWWSRELDEQRKKMRSAHRKITLEPSEIQKHRTTYNMERNSYVRILRKEKRTSWRRFAGEIRDDRWGRCFRWIKKGSADHEAPSVLRKPNGEYTKTLKETLRILLDTLIPSEDTTSQTSDYIPQREKYNHVRTNSEEVRKAIWRMSTRKAPGEDGITALILRKAWTSIHQVVTSLFDDLLEAGYFPKLWRTADVVTILKGTDKKREDPKSFRPVSLLPVLGKALEHLVCTRLNDEIKENIADSQHGFRKERSTLTAINEVKSWVNERHEKYVLGVFLDISGAFDNVDWKPLIEDMTLLGATPATVSMTRSYLSKRIAKITANHTSVSTTLTKGCPQGSGFGPTLWNVAANEILKNNQEGYTHRVAYADDIAALVAANTRSELVKRTEEHLKDLINWAKRYGLKFSTAKTMGLTLKGSLVHGFSFEFGVDRIKVSDKVKYLGVIIDTDMKFKSQIKHITQKETKEFGRLRGMIGRDWGVDFNAALLVYKAVYIPRITYAASIWSMDWSKTDRDRLAKGQRLPLLAVSGAYRTAPTEGLQVITGLLPLDLQIQWEGTRQEVKRGTLTQDEQEDIREKLIEVWQKRWDRSTKGRWTYKFIPDIKFRLSIPMELDHYITQYLTGHGNFAAKLHSLGLTDKPDCGCGGGIDDPEHALYTCNRWKEKRQNLINTVIDEGGTWPCDPDKLISTRKIYNALRRYSKETLLAKEQPEVE